MPARKLGKHPPRFDQRTLHFASYLTSSSPPTPGHLHWGTKIGAKNWGVMLNDREGDCTIAGAGHAEMLWTSERGNLKVISDAEIQKAYVTVTGLEGAAFNPDSGANDNGCNMLDVLNFWRKRGIGGHKIQAYASVSPQAISSIKTAIYLFGGIYVGVDLPLSAEWQIATGQPWTLTSTTGDGKPGSWGGHAVIITGFNDLGLTCVTWGETQLMDWAWFTTYCEEAYAVISPDWVTHGPIFNLQALLTDLRAII